MPQTQIIGQLTQIILQKACAHPLRVAIDGVDASGKTTFTDALAESLKATPRQIIRASVDDFHLPRAIRHRRGSLSPKGFYQDSFDYPALIKNLLKPLGPAGTRRYQTKVFDLDSDCAASSEIRLANDAAILLMDGIFLLRPELLPYWDLTILLHADFSNTLIRGVKRDAELFGSKQAAEKRYQVRYIPGQKIYHSQARPFEKADIVIDNDQLEDPKILRISKKLIQS